MKTETKIKITEFGFFIIFLLMVMVVTFLIVVIIKKNFGYNIPSYILLPFGTIILDVSTNPTNPIEIANIAGPSNGDYYYHRDYKTYNNH